VMVRATSTTPTLGELPAHADELEPRGTWSAAASESTSRLLSSARMIFLTSSAVSAGSEQSSVVHRDSTATQRRVTTKLFTYRTPATSQYSARLEQHSSLLEHHTFRALVTGTMFTLMEATQPTPHLMGTTSARHNQLRVKCNIRRRAARCRCDSSRDVLRLRHVGSSRQLHTATHARRRQRRQRT
jgi:hypothetical protein